MQRSVTRRPVSNGGGHQEPLGDSAYRAIKGLILEREVRPGQQLVEAKLAERLGMSRTPIRAALSRLEQEGLVATVAGKGAFVEIISPMDVAEIYSIREVIEGLAAQILARRITQREAAVLQELAIKADDPAATISDDLAFHSAIIEMCDSPRIKTVVDSLCLHALIYDERTGKLKCNGDIPIAGEEWVPDAHRTLAKKITSGDPSEAEEAARRHVREAKITVVKFLMGLDEKV